MDEPADVATADQAGRTDNPCFEEPPPPPPCEPGMPCSEEPPPPPDYPADWEGEKNTAAGSEEVPPPPPCAYRMAGGADYLKINAVVCDITRPFTVSGGKITVHFTPSSGNPSSGSTYEYSGDFGKFSVAGQGTYKVKLTADGGSIVAKGPGTATTPLGTFSAGGKEHYSLTPASC